MHRQGGILNAVRTKNINMWHYIFWTMVLVQRTQSREKEKGQARNGSIKTKAKAAIG